MKVVYNACYGGFGVSHDVLHAYAKRKGFELREAGEGTWKHLERVDTGEYFSDYEIDRDDQDLIAAIEEIGIEKAGGDYSELVIVDIPAGTAWRLREYDGLEHIEYAEYIDWNIAR